MAKICKNCGIKHENSAKKCAACGTPFNDEHIYAKKKKYLIIAICSVLLLAAAIGLIIFSTGPRAAVRRIMNAHKRNDFEAIVDTFPDFLLESEVLDSEEFLRSTEKVVGSFSQYIFSYNIEKAETPNSNERENYLELFSYFGGENFDESEVEDITIVWVNYKGNIPGFWPSQGTRFVVFKYKGEWCWWPSNINR